MPRRKINAAFKTVDDNRVGIPKAISGEFSWISGKERISVFLLMRTPGRYRVVTNSDVRADPDLVELYERNNAPGADGERLASDFNDDGSAVFGLQLLEAYLRPGPPEWRLDLPRIAVDLLNVRPPDDEVVVVVNDGFLEVWSIERFRAALDRR
jgi:hypothetical protein